MEKKIKHLEFIQAVIARQAKNSFVLKGWAITIVVALFALPSSQSALNHILAAYFIIFIFWLLDSYYLYQEKLFRTLYDHVRIVKEEEEIDFDMDTKKNSKKGNCSWSDTFISKTLRIFYLPLMAITILVFLLK